MLREDVADWFELDDDSPYMLLVADVRRAAPPPMTEDEQALFGIDKLNVPRSEIPAVTHVDYSARIQTVHAETNPRYHALLSAFKERTGCPVLVNTSFNVRGEPIVCTPEDAFRCFMGTEIEVLVGRQLRPAQGPPGPAPRSSTTRTPSSSTDPHLLQFDHMRRSVTERRMQLVGIMVGDPRSSAARKALEYGVAGEGLADARRSSDAHPPSAITFGHVD